MALLRPLLLDNVPSIQQSAALALGRLANYSDELAEAVVSNEILPQLVYSLSEQNVSTNHHDTAFILSNHFYFKRLINLPISIEILQEGRRIRLEISRQALSSPRQGCCQLRCS